MLDRQIRSIYSALDRSPNEQIALRVRHEDGFRWQIERRFLTASTEAGAALATIPLAELTIGELAARLKALGCTVLYLSPELAERSAGTLLRGEGNQSLSNGDALFAYDSLLWSVLDAYAIELEAADRSVDAALAQLYLNSASGEWLDFWGEFFGLPREQREDGPYRGYLIAETLRPRTNKIAIESAIEELTGKTVRIYEPWRDLFVLGESKMNGSHHLQDGFYYTHNVIQPVSDDVIDFGDVMRVVERNRPAGTVVAPPVSFPRWHVDASAGESSVSMGVSFIASLAARVASEGVLNSLRLSGEERPTTNHLLTAGQLISLETVGGLLNPGSISTRQNIRRANIVLSDGDEIGAMNAVFQRDYWHQPPSFLALSGAERLSDYEGRIESRPVDEIRPLYASGVSFAEVGSFASFGIWEERALHCLAPTPVGAEQVGIEFVDPSYTDLTAVFNPKPSMWGFDGAGVWTDGDLTWEIDSPWGDGVRQS